MTAGHRRVRFCTQTLINRSTLVNSPQSTKSLHSMGTCRALHRARETQASVTNFLLYSVRHVLPIH